LSNLTALEKQKSEKSLKRAVDTALELVKGESPEQLRMFTVWLNRMFKEAYNRIDGTFSRRNKEIAERTLK